MKKAKIHFLGASGTVTGSKFIIETPEINLMIDCGVFHMHTIKPFDNKGLIQASKSVELIVTIEEHVLKGGLGSAVLESFSDHDIYKKVIRLGIPDVFAEKYGSQDILLAEFGLDPENIVKTVKNFLTKKR